MRKPLTVSHHFTIFGGHWPSAKGDIKYLICHMTLQDHVIEGSRDTMGGSLSSYVTILSSLVAAGIVLAEICF